MAGKIDFVGPNFVILETADTGFKIFANSQTLTGIKTGKRSKLYLHHYLRENCEDLFGFLTFEELELFELLLTVSGIGPKAAMAILSRAKCGQIKNAILNNDLEMFMAISGVGRKTATRLILELKSKISVDDLSILDAGGDYSEVLEGLKSLGYKAEEAKKILAKTPKNLKTAEEKITWALKQMAK